MTYKEAVEILKKHGQEHVLKFWGKLKADEKKALLAQIAGIDFKELERCRGMLPGGSGAAQGVAKKGKPTAPKVSVLKGKTLNNATLVGEAVLEAGVVGVLLVAGGQGSRLGFDGPKGAYPIGPITGATLFQFHARKVAALQVRYRAKIPFYVMTSEANFEATVKHFEDNEFFGLNDEDVIFFRQGMWPALTAEGKIILDAPGHIFMSPDGHGGMISALKKTGCFEDMKKRGVDTLFYFQVDNPMVEIADPAFIGLHFMEGSEYSLKLCAKREPTEGLGMPVKRDGHFDLIEYTEMTDEMNNRRTKSGELYFKYGSPAIHVFDREFLEREAEKDMPLHLAHKKIAQVDDAGNAVKPEAPNGYKFEKFIFDALADAKAVSCMAFDRADEFSPVKNAEGKDSPETCKADLQAKWRRMLAKAGVAVDEGTPVEVDPMYALDALDVEETGLLLSVD